MVSNLHLYTEGLFFLNTQLEKHLGFKFLKIIMTPNFVGFHNRVAKSGENGQLQHNRAPTA
jgi:hypothetical protein